MTTTMTHSQRAARDIDHCHAKPSSSDGAIPNSRRIGRSIMQPEQITLLVLLRRDFVRFLSLLTVNLVERCRRTVAHHWPSAPVQHPGTQVLQSAH